MTKRIIALFLVCILAVPLLALPASATGAYDEGIYDGVYATWETLHEFYFSFVDWQTTVTDWFGSFSTDLEAAIAQLEIVDKSLGKIKSLLDLNFPDIVDYLASIATYVQDLYLDLDGWITEQTDLINSQLVELQTNVVTVISDLINLVEVKFTSLQSWISDQTEAITGKLDNIFTGTEDDQAIVDSDKTYQDEVLKDYSDSMAEITDATRPVIEDIELDVSGKIPENGVLSYAQVLYPLLRNTYIYAVFFCAFTFAMVSYGIFGKR